MYKHIYNTLGIGRSRSGAPSAVEYLSSKTKERTVPKHKAYKKNAVHQADLLFLPTDDGYKYALVVVDVFDRSVDAEALRTKNPEDVLDAFGKIYRRRYLSVPTHQLKVDSGGEFKGVVGEYFRNKGVLISTGLPSRSRQQAVVETQNKVIGKVLLQRMRAQQMKTGKENNRWVAFLPKVVGEMNKYRNEKPAVRQDKEEGAPRCKGSSCKLLDVGTEVHRELDAPEAGGKKFRASDLRYEPKAREVKQVLLKPDQPPMYLVEGIKSAAYTREQLKVKREYADIEDDGVADEDDEVEKYVVERLVGHRQRGNRLEFEVKWKGYTETTWEPRASLMKDVPEMVRAYEKRKKVGTEASAGTAAAPRRTTTPRRTTAPRTGGGRRAAPPVAAAQDDAELLAQVEADHSRGVNWQAAIARILEQHPDWSREMARQELVRRIGNKRATR
jgi:hypothetical protein